MTGRQAPYANIRSEESVKRGKEGAKFNKAKVKCGKRKVSWRMVSAGLTFL